MMEVGRTTREMAKEFITMRMVIATMVTGRMIRNMAMVYYI